VTGGGRHEYERRVDRVIDEVRQHLAEPLTLAALARVAAFSPYHFARVFKSVTGETLFAFVQRLRLEKAAGALLARPHQKILAIALDHGFGSAATFARAFRTRFGMTATRWRAGGARRRGARRRRPRNPGTSIRTPRKAARRRRVDTASTRRQEVPTTVHVRDLPDYHVARMRSVGPYGARGIPELWARLRSWIDAHEIDPDARLTLGVAYDDPSITAPGRCRYDACVVVPADFRPDRLVDIVDIPASRCAIAEFVGTAHEIQEAWDRMFRGWLPSSGYQPDDRPCIERYRGNPTIDTRAGTFRCELCLPVRPL
jgi:AraC family transcriptional regulator